MSEKYIEVIGAQENNLKNIHIKIPKGKICAITGVSGSGKSSLAFDTILSEAQRKFFYTLSYYSRQFLSLNSKAKVTKIVGLSPAISLAQYEAQPSSRASIATLTDLNELLGLVFAKFAIPYCPKHHEKTQATDLNQMMDLICQKLCGRLIALSVVIANNKKGSFKKQLEDLATKGFLNIYCDGKIRSLVPMPKLDKEKKHTIKLIIDYIKIPPKPHSRFVNSIKTALSFGQGYFECIPSTIDGEIDNDSAFTFSTREGCSECGFSWPKVDSRFFSSNSLGQCQNCKGIGYHVNNQDEESQDTFFYESCESCKGTGIDSKYSSFLFEGQSIQDLYVMSVSKLLEFFKNNSNKHLAFQRLRLQITNLLKSINKTGLSYLSLHRKIKSLSLGEHQRIKLAGVLAHSLTGVIYVLDEPSQGLHITELKVLFKSLESLAQKGNTVIIVDHDPFLLTKSEWILDLGPEGGKGGGYEVASFNPSDLRNYKEISETADFLYEYTKKKQIISKTFEQKTKNQEFIYITIKNAYCHNLKIPEVKFKVDALNLITGVSGSGKTSLAIHTLYQNALNFLKNKSSKKRKLLYCEMISGLDDFDQIIIIDRKPLAKTSISMPATYLKIFPHIRKIFSSQSIAKISGLTPSDFSTRSKQGRCEECQGRGYVILSMKFLEDARVVCSSCQGKRYKDYVLAVKYKGHSISDVLELTIEEAVILFQNYKAIVQPLKLASSLGLSYLKLGQSISSLSGGEAQRLKMTQHLNEKKRSKTLLFLDEPTRGLHEKDVFLLRKVLKSIVETKKTTIILIEHHLGMLEDADWVIDLGPGAADKGGTVVFQGEVKKFLVCKKSLTASSL